MSLMGAALGIPTPLHDGGIALFSALYGRDFVAENDLLPEVAVNRDSLLALSRNNASRTYLNNSRPALQDGCKGQADD